MTETQHPETSGREARARLREMIDRATAGPWAWFGNGKNCDLYLATINRGRQYVMGFQRWGMREAQPVFRVGDRMVPASALLKFEVGDQSITGIEAARTNESVYRSDVRDVDAPDAALMVAAVNVLPALLDALDAQDAELARLRSLVIDPGDPAWEDARGVLPMDDAPRDGTVILGVTRTDLPESEGGWSAARWNGRFVPMKHEGVTVSDYDLGWSVALPVGHGGLPDQWFAGWLPLSARRSALDAQEDECRRLREALGKIADRQREAFCGPTDHSLWCRETARAALITTAEGEGA